MEKEKALNTAIQQIERSHGKGSIMRFGEVAASREVQVIPTGALCLDLALSITGIAGPEADRTEKPVGLTHLWLAAGDGGESRRFVFEGDRWGNRRHAVSEALSLLLGRLGEA